MHKSWFPGKKPVQSDIMEKIGELGGFNSQLQIEIDILEELVDIINTVLEGDIDWQQAVALPCVVTHCESQIGLLKFQKELNKKEMSNLLLQALQQ